MRAQVLTAYNQPYTLRETPLPNPTEPNDILIQVGAASYCHTDAVLASGQMPGLPLSFPHAGSHEFAGTVVAHAPSPSPLASSLAPGTAVGVPGRSFRPCGTCFECTKAAGNAQDDDAVGYSVYCARAQNLGISVDGGFREYAVVDARQVAPLPAGMASVDASVLMCAGVTVYGALSQAGVEPGGRIGIVGCGGGLGHLGLQFAVRMGYKVVGVESADAPLALARGLDTGAWIVDTRETDAAVVAEKVGREDGKSDRGHMGLDAVIILPESQKAFDYGMALLRTHGKCVVVSFPEKGFHVSARDLVFRHISVLGSLVGSNRTLREMLNFAAKHDVRAKIKTFPLSKLNELVEEYHKGEGGKLVIDMSLETPN
ncbi:Alcohol dehydrogenase superfamily zinc-containing [Macrophomina phaseolina MS6]|uniref:Alcohol dehydrogenase superfamily zinc-containing n=1 Tax=Macrophomina phaseolina (strain MS6) TaxID=1126212 RepID=K2RAD2_MACPH|nr:Alcohol dehydrogenase superfamily zinc-containing [Macrophomina phaseolina MS6]